MKPYSQAGQTASILDVSIMNPSQYSLQNGYLIAENITPLADHYTFSIGMYYKVQIAYIDHYGNKGPYSSVAIVKCLGASSVTGISVAGLQQYNDQNEDYVNNAQQFYIGQFYNDSLAQDSVYQYRFVLKEKNTNKLIKDTGWLRPTYDANQQPIMSFSLNQSLNQNLQYLLCFEVTTLNGYTDSIEYTISGQQLEYPNQFDYDIEVFQDSKGQDNGYITIQLKDYNRDNYELPPTGNFILLRNEIGADIWETVTHFQLQSTYDVTQFTWNDFMVEAGKKYMYAIQQYYTDIATQQTHYSSKRLANSIIVPQFDHMFLSDAEHQLRISFNPQVSNFKDIVQESKVETLGSKYPYIFRNGTIQYKEINISGLISYHMDPDEFFIKQNFISSDTRLLTETSNAQEAQKFVRMDGLQQGILNENLIHYTGTALQTEDDPWHPVRYEYFLSSKDNNLSLERGTGLFSTNNPAFHFSLTTLLEENKIYSLEIAIFNENNEVRRSNYDICQTLSTMPSIQLTNENFAKEKDFKLKVLEWLNNGKPKAFRSPAEGNYIIQLMNVTLSPEATVGRMLHSFQATAYEMADNTMENLQNMSLVAQSQFAVDAVSRKENITYSKTYYFNDQATSATGNIYIAIPISNSTQFGLKGDADMSIAMAVLQCGYKNRAPYATTNSRKSHIQFYSFYVDRGSGIGLPSIDTFSQHLGLPWDLSYDSYLLVPLNSGFKGQLDCDNTFNPTSTDTFHDVDVYRNICRYGKIKEITLNSNRTWDDEFNIIVNNELGGIKQLQRLYKIIDFTGDQVEIIFDNGSNMLCADISQLQVLESNEHIVQIRPIGNASITFSGLVTYATSAELGRYHLGNSRLGDDYV